VGVKKIIKQKLKKVISYPQLVINEGGSSKVAKNIRLLCARHNLQKGAKFQ
tara:strand:- start:230 stop:382 length:153 start_codon:yes stop_codon:yes gene_type:complete